MTFYLETERLFLTDFDENDNSMDFQALYSYRSLKDVQKYQSWRPNTIEDVKSFISRLPKNYNFHEPGWYQLAIRLKESNLLIGDIGLHIMETMNEVELGITLHPDYQGKGYASEALSAVINYVFITLLKNLIICSIDPRNSSSKALLERLGFEWKETVKEAYELHGEIVDDMIFILRKPE